MQRRHNMDGTTEIPVTTEITAAETTIATMTTAAGTSITSAGTSIAATIIIMITAGTTAGRKGW